jgi:hypothetical protein
MKHTAAPSARLAKTMRWAILPAALVVSGLVIAPASYSAFSSTTANPTSNWTAGTVMLADDDASSALFTATGLRPGSTGTKCIVVTSSGNLPSTVKLYGTGAATTNALSGSITLAVTQGTGGSFGSCTGFTPLASGASVYNGTLAAFAAGSTGFATGLGNWAPTGSASESRTYQFVYTVDAAAPNTTQGGTASIAFTWEAQNN